MLQLLVALLPALCCCCHEGASASGSLVRPAPRPSRRRCGGVTFGFYVRPAPRLLRRRLGGIANFGFRAVPAHRLSRGGDVFGARARPTPRLSRLLFPPRPSALTPHSPKRGGICMASGNEVVKWEAVELRADHKCGLTSTYQTCAAPQQDGIMGRLFSGLAFGTEQFNVIAPHFKPEHVLQIPFQEFITHYTKYSTTFRTVIPFLVASVVFHLHNGKLKQLLPKEHPFWSSQFVLQHRRVWMQLGSMVRYTTIHHHTPLCHCSLRFWVARWAQSLY